MGCKIIIKDTNKMMDSKMNICIQGLKKFEEIKIILETNCFYNINAPMNWSENTFWQSEAIFLSDSNGIVSLEKSPSIGGDYTGIRSMGLFESLKAVTIVNILIINHIIKCNIILIVLFNVYLCQCIQ